VRGAIAWLAHNPLGTWAFGLVAAGLVAYALFLFVAARYRQIVCA
jgi:hypothetical protein